MTKFLIAGLGNIGNEYAGTRHNIGFDIADAFAEKHGGTWRPDRYAHAAEVKLKGRLLICIKPTTYMNLSGKAVRYWMDKENIPVENLLVLLDELALPLNKMRLRLSGSDGGHNGLKDIQALLATTEYARLRFGIGNNYPKGTQADFVLSRWKPEELPVVNAKVLLAVQTIEHFALAGASRAMNFCNAADAAPSGGL
jgi:peptidyl-tRNA hydrolase, PTH1 family